MNSANKKQICGLIEKSSNPLILIPEDFDIDTVSGAFGLYLFLKKNKKTPSIACSISVGNNLLSEEEKKVIQNGIQEDCLYKLSFDTGKSRIKELSYVQEGGILKINLAVAGGDFELEKPRVDLLKFNHDLVFVLGSPDLKSLGKIYYDNVCFFSEMPIVNIDCRAKNEKFGNINLVQSDASVSEIIAEIAGVFSRDTLDSRMADLFLTGIVAKTNNFQAKKIKPETFVLTSFLLRTGANREEIIKRLISVNLLSAEKIEFYPPLKTIKEIIDKINKESSWYLRQEKDKIKEPDGLKLLFLNQRFIYFAVALGALPGLIYLDQAGVFSKFVFKKNDNIFSQENSTEFEEKKALVYAPIFLAEERNALLSSEAESVFSQNKKIETSAGFQDKAAIAPPQNTEEKAKPIVKEDIKSKSAAEEKKNIVWENKEEKKGIPKKLSMPSFGINTEIQETGLIANGEMGIPGNYKSVAWFNLGVKPGELGSAVIAGHLDTNLGKAGVFWNLNKMKPGDYVYVMDEYNEKMRFRVERSELYDAENAPMEEIFGPSGVARLNLITCNGAWDKEKKSYNKRLVVFTQYDPE